MAKKTKLNAYQNLSDEYMAVSGSDWPVEQATAHPLEGRFTFYNKEGYPPTWFQIIDGRLHRIASAWDLAADRIIVDLSPEQFATFEIEE